MDALNTALSYLERAWPVFPCRDRDETTDNFDPETGEVEVLKVKTPLTSNGFKSATKFRHIIERWWRDWPTAMIGVPTGAPIQAWVLDIDPRHNGHITLEQLEEEYGSLPSTLTATTASGGKHYYFRYVHGVRNRGNLGEGIDVRGDGGYVVAPGSVTAAGGRYEWDNDFEPVDAPAWLLDLVVRREQPTATVHHGNAHTNSAYVNAAVDRELADLANEPMGNRNNRLNDASFALGQFVGAGALPESEARALLQDVARGWGRDWARCAKTIENGLQAGKRSPRDIPQPEQDNTRLIDISRMIENGLRKAKEREKPAAEARAADKTRPQDDAPPESCGGTPAVAPAQQDNTPQDNTPAFTATAFTWRDPRKLPRREFAFGTHYIRKFVSVTVSPGGLGKTSNSIVEALSMTSGRALTGTKPSGRLKVWLFNAEDPRDEMERRIMAACIHYKLKPADIDGHLFLDTGREQELVVMEEDRKTGLRINKPIVEAVVEQIRANDIDVMIIDPFVSTHRVNENDNGAIDKVAKLWAQIADMTNCAVDVVHHLRKMSDREATVEDARGAVSLIGAARSVRVLNRMSDDQATKAGVDPKERYSYFWIHYGKANLTKIDSGQHWRKMESVALGNGTGPMKPQDHAGVVTEWHWPGAEEIVSELTPDQIQMIKVTVDNGQYKKGANAKNWVGRAIAYALELDPEDEGTRGRVTSVFKALTKEGILVEIEEKDPVRRDTSRYIRSVDYRLAA